jgi:hypothetical protein
MNVVDIRKTNLKAMVVVYTYVDIMALVKGVTLTMFTFNETSE